MSYETRKKRKGIDMIKQPGKKIICGPLSPMASIAFDIISSYVYKITFILN